MKLPSLFKKRIILLYFLSILLFSSALPAGADEKAADAAHILKEKGISPLLVTGLISMVPIFELRGGIPVGIGVLKQNLFLVYLYAVLFNLIPVFPVLLLLNPVKRLLEKLPVFSRFFGFLTAKAEKNKKLIEKYEEFGLMLFVAVPLPVTGAWTGSLVAVVMGLNVVKSFLFISLGVLIAGVVVTLLTVLGTTGIILAVAILLTFIIVYTVNIIRKRSDTV